MNREKLKIEIIDFIINCIGDKNRGVKDSDLSGFVYYEFKDRFDCEREVGLFYNSTINSLLQDYLLIRKSNSVIELTEEGYNVFNSKEKFYGFLKQRDFEKKMDKFSKKLNIANFFVAVLATFIAACTLWTSYNNIGIYAASIFWGIPSFIIGFCLKDLIMIFKRFRKRRN